ncbi:MAG TPA: asparagine synthase (glutamine-hydrolyzing) [Trebonia sp.]|jgi:asparagine synthase (glutamine-hydrolysing)|nr:asparagine synthase (glutamine-hydrolyzing) [Trebonia sp.]
MCGIAGCYQQSDGRKLADVMTDRIAHRGPDAGGVWSHEDERVSLHLGHRRLSIIDLSAAADQPFRKGNLALLFNGEIYNYKELRTQLQAAGATFITSSDTEVVLEGWRVWGPAALDRFRGMFALALADTATGELVLARDPLGIKPLFYMQRGDGMVFASELKALISALGSELRIDPGTLVASMLYYWVPEQRCAIQGVQKLPAGSWARIRPGGALEIRQYWQVRDVAAAAARQPAADLRSTIEESVRAHLVADVPVSSFLSGGLDSSIITVLAHQDASDVDAYTITFRPEDQKLEAMPDDAVYARKVARQFGITLHEIEISPDVVDMLPRMVDILDEPIGDPAAINTVLMCQAARERGVKVLLSGMGADELFGGYRKHLACQMASRYHRLPGLVRGPARLAVNSLPVSIGNRGLRYPRWAKRFMTFAELPEEARFRRSYTLYDPADLTALVGPDLGASVAEVVGEHAAIYQDNDLDDEVNRMCLADARLFMAGLNLTYTDRASMAASVEVRVPFVDKVVAEAAFTIPGSDKIRGRVQKAALKDAASNWLPHEIVHRPKASFGAPLRAWVRNDLRELINDVLVGGELVQLGMLRREPLLRLIADERAGREDNAKQIWQLLSMELWYRQARAAGVAA